MLVAMLLTTMLQFPFYIGFGLVYSSFNDDLFDSHKLKVNFGTNNTYNKRRNYCEDKTCINYKDNRHYINSNTNHKDNLEEDYKSICNLPNESGPCLASIPRYFYNAHNGKCEQFIYGGCGGNSNNFLDIKSCEQYCIRESSNDICLLPQETGPCKSFIERYYYNPIRKQCETFLYGGCGGNGNNFVDMKSCSKQCIQDTYQSICLQPVRRGPCTCSFKRYFFNLNTKKCEEFIYGGCEGNENNFCTLELCQQKCSSNFNSLTLMAHNTGLAAPNKEICALEPEAGPCLAYMPRYYYDPNTGQCQTFIYGGCGGNGNNFNDIKSCKRFCIEETSFGNLCSLPPDKGPCKAIIERYYYNPATKDCEQFIYGGCQGNANNFVSEDLCEEKCEPAGEKLPPICYLSFDKGPCKGNYKRYYYDQHTDKCEAFIYGGCRGNANNFITKDMCEEICD